MQTEQHNAQPGQSMGAIVDNALTDDDPIFLGILDEMLDSGVMNAGCRPDQYF